MGINYGENSEERKSKDRQLKFETINSEKDKYHIENNELAISTTKAESEENSLRIDLLEEGQKIEQFKEMINNQYLLDTHDILGASSNYYTTKVYIKGISNILQGFYSAYENHLPICLTPDIIWLLIVQGFAHHVNFNEKYYREKLVNFDGKKTLEVIISKYHSYKQMKSEDYEYLFENLTEQIKSNIGEELINTINFNFSTSNKITKVVGYTSIMSAVKKYFIFCGNCHMCKYPFIILKGKIEDWENILKKTKELSKYKLEHWINALEPILTKIIETKNGKMDKNFWKEIIYPDKVDKRIEIGVYEYKTIKVDGIKGWLLLFFPYFKDGRFRYEKDLKTEDIWRLPDRLLKTPLIMKSDDEGITNMIIYSGFIGMSVDKEKNNLVTPEIGWYVKEKSSKDNNEKHNNIRHPFDYDDSSSDN